ncbi:hypothetical protein [Laribacter hongkongensis]|uniref:hypothetical protein n=1 Tax=Laribacter hongkongensis TaxID=168471 RepID=UPI001EFDF4F0|nr:hypothetical protein [Laribacter hongkongensis]MCG9039912.1 hypothetical protein [Laribacter hongkongensis]MCG9066581.1 hypothetical protein [Laribacter hongkongensis]
MNASRLLIVRRRHAGNFTQIPNSLIRNEHLSLKALGVIVHLLSLPPGYRISLEGLCAVRKEGETAMRTAIKQLESLNYMRIVRDRSASGQFIQSRWIVSDEPIVDWAPHLENPRVEEPVLDQPVQGDQGATNTVFVETLNSSKTTTTEPEASRPDTDKSSALILDERDEECWLWLCQKLSLEPQKTLDQFAGLPIAVALDVLAEVLECKRQNSIRKTVPQFLASLLRRAREGKFTLSAGSELRRDLRQIIRRQRAVEAAVEPAQTIETDRPSVDMAQVRERVQRMRDELAKKAQTPVMPRGTA